MARNLGKEEIADLCAGATILGTGGGGSPELGLSILNRLLEKGKQVRMISAEEVPPAAVVVNASMVGSIAPGRGGEMGMEEYIAKISSPDGPLLTSLRNMEEAISEKVFATLPVELGGYNTPVAAIVASLAGLPFVDGDTIGRAKPELMMQTYTVLNVPITPLAIADFKGNAVLVKKVAGFRDAEKIARAMAVVGDGTFVVRCPVRGEVLRKGIVAGGVTRAIEIGRALREADAARQDPLRAAIQASGGTEFFRGEVTKFEWEDRDGFLWGTLALQGSGSYAGHELKIWLKNENMLSWLDGRPHVVTPDLICVIDAATGRGVTNADVGEGRKLAVFGIPAAPFWRRPEALDLVSPRHFDFDIPYTPMEKVLAGKL